MSQVHGVLEKANVLTVLPSTLAPCVGGCCLIDLMSERGNLQEENVETK